MEFIKRNYLDTTSAIVVGSNTEGAKFLFSTDFRQQYITSGFNDDNTTASIRVNFDSTKTVSRICLYNMDLREFSIYYNGVTANSISLSTTAMTTVASFTGNSQTSLYFICTPVDCTSISIDMKKTITANQEKAIGWLYIGDVHVDFPIIPNSSNYDIELMPKQIEHTLADGGTRIQYLRDLYKSNVKLNYISNSFKQSLKTVYDLQSDFVFVPFPETTANWDKIIFPCVWTGPFKFHEYSDDAADSGFSGTITLKQAPI